MGKVSLAFVTFRQRSTNSQNACSVHMCSKIVWTKMADAARVRQSFLVLLWLVSREKNWKRNRKCKYSYIAGSQAEGPGEFSSPSRWFGESCRVLHRGDLSRPLKSCILQQPICSLCKEQEIWAGISWRQEMCWTKTRLEQGERIVQFSWRSRSRSKISESMRNWFMNILRPWLFEKRSEDVSFHLLFKYCLWVNVIIAYCVVNKLICFYKLLSTTRRYIHVQRFTVHLHEFASYKK